MDDFDPTRLRHGELIAGSGAAILLVALFALPWYELDSRLAPSAATLGARTTVDGWDGLSTIRWLLLITALTGLALALAQAGRRAPALPVTLSVVVTILGGIATLALVYRVLLNPPGVANALLDPRAGAYVGLVACAGIVVGGVRSMRQEGIAPRDGPAEIPTVKL